MTPARPWGTLLLTVSVLVASLGVVASQVVDGFELTRSGLSSGEFWRLWTCTLVHFGPMHASADALALLVGAVWFERRNGTVMLVSCVLVVAPLTSGGVLVFEPEVQVVRGASALAVFLIASAWFEFWFQRSVSRLALAALAGVFLARQGLALLGPGALGLDRWSVTSSPLPSGVEPAATAHLMAVALSGLAVWWLRNARRGSRPG